MMDRRVVVAGNGPSIASLEPGCIQADDFIIRINNFFFEPRFFLGQRVDLAFMAGDPRVAPFMFETLHQCRADYDLRAWSSHNPRVVRAGQRRFGALYQPMRYRDSEIEAEVKTLIARYNRSPTTGVYAVLMAHAIGAQEIIMAGLDLYSTPQRYPYELGPHYRALMGQDLAARGIDSHLHHPQLDLDILKVLKTRDDVRLLRACDTPALKDLTDWAPVQGTPSLDQPRHSPPTDWAARSGFYSIELLKVLRRGSALLRQIRKES
ncbi:hypothetical protein [Parasedimentitalea huanghaiensis]|uniref:Alpha-2,3-sialyltransferase (CST-I) n=1 Tax=Parasedimentitalea huanghaiensis TaxID=2682100 RepID=A0A6L6WKZ8_9RHOB|nr:hypothetical protein [Zongyanglinia huanghaiensis]MVO18516.1 hypothetical protein [Zongyanglinia huanghaiensis]